MTVLNQWSRDLLARFWALQKRALLADLRLTLDVENNLHLRSKNRNDQLPDMDAAEAAITMAEAVSRE